MRKSVNIFLVLLATLTPFISFALPTYTSITEGQATVSQASQTTTINQQSTSAILQWNSFNINTNESVVFNQPSSSSITINNILDQNPSQILGSITANGRIVLLNANGFYFGASSSISANTFIAAATSLNNTTYNSTTNTLTTIDPSLITATITTNGTITTTKTQLTAKTIATTDTSTITSSTISIKATNDISLHGTFTATNAVDLFATSAIVGAATITASSITATTDYLSYAGDLTATNTISLTATNILLSNLVNLTAPSTTIQANNTAIISATINANSPSNAGTIIINATNNLTLLSATFTAQSTQQGNGGFIEISTKGTLKQHNTTISTTAVNGRTGTLLIDPDYLIITDSIPESYDYFKQLVIGFSDGAVISNPITSLASTSYFGDSVALNSTYALIGAYGVSTNRGNTYLYNLSSGTWTDLSITADQPITSLASNSYFGDSVALNSTYALIGAYGVSTNRGNTYLYNLSSGTWTDLSITADQPITSLASNSYFGDSVALNSTYALIGAYGVSTNRGNTYLYNLSSGTWTDLSITADQPITSLASNSYFGDSVALNSTYALIGAYGVSLNRGSTYLYVLPNVTFRSTYDLVGELASNNVELHADRDISILSSITSTSTNSFTLISGGTIGNVLPSTAVIRVGKLILQAQGDIGTANRPLLVYAQKNTTVTTPGNKYITYTIKNNKAKHYEGFISQLLYDLVGSIKIDGLISFDCVEDDIVATLSIKVICSIGL
ncbi:MAG: filamentous hemagglutinin N-terminal domain-containing protein [Methylacidiphilales bacterium]|nr:filamentous hemagglutinin N-terminal domain-containing protein [Candidatus Methylacidiphilales bacterium]